MKHNFTILIEIVFLKQDFCLCVRKHCVITINLNLKALCIHQSPYEWQGSSLKI